MYSNYQLPWSRTRSTWYPSANDTGFAKIRKLISKYKPELQTCIVCISWGHSEDIGHL